VLDRTRLVGVVMQDAEIDGLVTNLVVNGVEVSGYVEAELDRRHPVRVLLRSEDPGDLRAGFTQLQEQWAATVARLRAEPGLERRSINDEWSALQTMRHLVFVHDSWYRRCVLGSTEPFTPLGLAISFVPNQRQQGLDPDADPSLEEVLAVRAEQGAELAGWLATVTTAELTAPAPVPAGDGWPPYARGRTVRRCLSTVLTEEFEHHGFCVRDLDLIADRARTEPAVPPNSVG
jgi:hypothetical protein